jgi:hypothetical protein
MWAVYQKLKLLFFSLCSLILNVEFESFGQKWCKIWGSYVGNYDDYWLLGCDTVLSGRCVATFRRNFATSTIYPWSRDSSVGIATDYGLEGRGVGVRVPVVAKIFSSRCRLNRFWGPPCLLSNGYRGLFPRGVKLTTHLQLVPKSIICGSIHPLPHTSSWCSA